MDALRENPPVRRLTLRLIVAPVSSISKPFRLHRAGDGNAESMIRQGVTSMIWARADGWPLKPGAGEGPISKATRQLREKGISTQHWTYVGSSRVDLCTRSEWGPPTARNLARCNGCREAHGAGRWVWRVR